MEKMPNQEKEIIRLEYLTTQVGLVRQPDGKYLLDEIIYSGDVKNENSSEHIPTIKPDRVLRPEGDTTFLLQPAFSILKLLNVIKLV